jgi:phosphoribosylanthranilate isomerase
VTRTRVKFCGLVRPEDVDAAVAIGADAIGFVFYAGSSRLLDSAAAAALRRRLPSWVTAVGLFVNETPAEIDRVAAQVGLDVVQLHGDETVTAAKALRTRWWKAIRIGGAAATQPAEGVRLSIVQALDEYRDAEFCLLDSFSPGFGGSGRTFDWSLVPGNAGHRLIMSGGLDAANVGAAIASVAPFAVDTSSGIQAPDPRRKDVGRMEQFMEAVRRADGRRDSHEQ